MNNTQKWITVLWFALLGTYGFAQVSTVNQGKPGNQGPWPVTISGSGGGSSGSVTVTEQPCANPVESVITFDGGGATPIPAAGALTSRRFLTICNSPKNSGVPLWTVRADGTAPTIAASSPGQTLGLSDCISYFKAATSSDGGVPIYGIADTNGSVLTITECQ